jgi:hypothetical protein
LSFKEGICFLDYHRIKFNRRLNMCAVPIVRSLFALDIKNTYSVSTPTLSVCLSGEFFLQDFQNFFDIWWNSLNGKSARRKASTYTRQHNTEIRGQTSMPRMGFEPTVGVTEAPRLGQRCHCDQPKNEENKIKETLVNIYTGRVFCLYIHYHVRRP